MLSVFLRTTAHWYQHQPIKPLNFGSQLRKQSKILRRNLFDYFVTPLPTKIVFFILILTDLHLFLVNLLNVWPSLINHQ